MTPKHSWYTAKRSTQNKQRRTVTRGQENARKGGVFKSVLEGFEKGGLGQCCLRPCLTERLRRGVDLEWRNGSPAPLKWRCMGQWCREEHHLRPINQSHQNHIITTFPDTLISCFTWARKTRDGGEESEKNSALLVTSPLLSNNLPAVGHLRDSWAKNVYSCHYLIHPHVIPNLFSST